MVVVNGVVFGVGVGFVLVCDIVIGGEIVFIGWFEFRWGFVVSVIFVFLIFWVGVGLVVRW